MFENKEMSYMKKIFGAKTSKKIATLLSMSALILPLAGCTSKSMQQQAKNQRITEDETTQLQGPRNFTATLCDTSYIDATNLFNEYVQNYESGNTSYIKEQMDSLKSTYKETLITPPGFMSKTGPDGITFNFDGTPLLYDDCTIIGNSYRSYTNAGITIKKIYEDSVQIKTKDGNITLKNNSDGNFVVTNENEKAHRNTTIFYNSDGSYTIKLNSPDEHSEYNYSSDGLIKSSNINSDTKRENRVYLDGNLHTFTEQNGSTQKIENEDGTYKIKTESNYIRFGENGNWLSLPWACEITYYYDSSDTPLRAVVDYHDKNNNALKCTATPDGNYTIATQKRSNGKIVYSGLTRQIDNKLLQRFERTVDNNDIEHTFVETTDYSLTQPKYLFHDVNTLDKGDITFRKRDGIAEIEQKNDFIYHYKSETGEFMEAYKVNGTSSILHADENGNITRYEDKTKEIFYYDYENNIKQNVRNKSTSTLRIDFNGEVYDLEKDGYISYNDLMNIILYRKNPLVETLIYDNGKKEIRYYEDEHSLKTKKIEYYNDENLIYSIFQDGVRTDYYDYQNNKIKSIDDHGIQKNFYEDTQSLSSIYVRSLSNDEPCYYDGYELILHSALYYHPNGYVKKYYYDNTKFFEKDEHGNYIGRRMENNTLYEYYPNKTKLRSITTNMDNPETKLETVYADYEKNIVSSIQSKHKYISYYTYGVQEGEDQQISVMENYCDEPLIAYDKNGNAYTLNNNDKINFYKNGNVKYLKQGLNEYKYTHPKYPNYYFIITPDSIEFCHNEYVLYRSADQKYKNLNIHSIYEKNGIMYITLSNGSESVVLEEQLENNIVTMNTPTRYDFEK